MTKRPLCLGAAGVLSGILAAAYGWSVFARALLACGVLACGILGGIFADGYRPGDGISPAERKRTAFGAGVFLLMFALGSGRYLEAEESRQAYLGELQDGMYVTVQGQLAGKQVQKNRYVYELTSCMFRTDSSNFLQAEPVSCGGVLIYSDSDDCSIGDILIYHGEITLWKRASNEGAFDAKAYYFARGFDFAMEGPALDRKVCAKRQTAEALWQLGQQIKEVYLKTMGERDAGILATMVVGDREFLDAETKRLYQIGGLSHILAISGLHISVIGMALYRMLKKAGLPFGMAALAAAGVMYGYGGMAGWGVSVRRAVLMFLLFLGAQVIGRSYDTFCALAFAAVALLWKNPCLFWDAGFRFSFVAILGVVWVGQSISYEKKGMGALRGKIFAASAVWFTTLPLVAWYFYEIPVYAVFVNLLMLPMMGVLLGFGAAGGMVGLLSLPLAKGMLFHAEFCSLWGSIYVRLPVCFRAPCGLSEDRSAGRSRYIMRFWELEHAYCTGRESKGKEKRNTAGGQSKRMEDIRAFSLPHYCCLPYWEFRGAGRRNWICWMSGRGTPAICRRRRGTTCLWTEEVPMSERWALIGFCRF